MTSQEALADAAELIRSTQLARNCSVTGTRGYCPVLVIGASYSGFLAAMMRMRYPAVVDMAYASSAPLKFYSQEVQVAACSIFSILGGFRHQVLVAREWLTSQNDIYQRIIVSSPHLLRQVDVPRSVVTIVWSRDLPEN